MDESWPAEWRHGMATSGEGESGAQGRGAADRLEVVAR
jgi:hypothetical protein